MDIVFPREEAYLDALGGKKEDDDGAAEPAEDAVVANQPELVMKQLKFVNVLVTTPSVKKRVWIWRKIVPGIVFQQAEWSKEVLDKILAATTLMLYRTVDVYSDRTSQLVVESFVSAVLSSANSDLVSSFIAAFLKRFSLAMATATQTAVTRMRQTEIVLLRWSCDVVMSKSGLEFLTSQKKFGDFAKLQFRLIDAVASISQVHARDAAQHKFLTTLSKRHEAFQLYITALGSEPARYECAALGLLTHHATKNPELLKSVKEKFLKAYVALIFGDRTAPPRHIHEALAPLISTFTSDEFGTSLKRNPEVVIGDVPILLSHLSLDLSPFVKALGVMAFSQLRSSEITYRAGGLAIVQQTVRKISDPAALEELMKELSAFVAGLTDYKSRLAAVEAIGALDAASLTREDKLRVAVVAIEALQTLLKKEGMDEVRVAAVMALGLWLSYTSKITPDAKQLYLAGFKDVKDTTRHAYLESFIVALKSAREDWTLSSLNVISDFVDPLITLAKTAMTQLKSRKDLVYAFTALSLIASLNGSTADAKLTKEGLWRAVLGDATGAPAKPAAAAAAAAAAKGKGKEKETEKPMKEAESCFLFKRKFLNKLDEREGRVLAVLSETLLQFHYTRVVAAMSQQKERDEVNRARGKVASAKNVFGLLVYLLTCPWNAPRKEAARVVSKHNSEKDELSELLVRAFFQAVKPAAEDDLAAKKVAIEKEEDVPTAKSDDGQARSSIYFHALLNCLKADGQDKETSQSRREAIHRVLPFVLVLAHHPFILPSVQYQCWARCLAIAGISLKDYSQDDTKATINDLLHFLFEGHSELGISGVLLSANKYINSAAYSALSSLAKMLPAALGAVVSHASRLMASSVPLQRLTNNQLEIYRTPSTELWTPKSEEYVAQVVESQNIKKLKGQKMYDQADAAWEAEMRKKLGQDKKDKTPQLTPAEQAERTAHLARQANLRARVDARVQKVRAALQAISSLATNVPHVAHLQLPAFLVLVRALIPHKLNELQQEAELTLASLAQISFVLQKLFRASKRNADGRLVISWDKELLKLIPSGINDIADIIHSRRDNEHRLSPQGFCFVLPVIEAVLMPGDDKDYFGLTIQEDALYDLELHSRAPAGVQHIKPPPQPFADVFGSILVYLLENAARFKNRAKEALLSLAAELDQDQLPSVLDGLLSREKHVRQSSLQAFQVVPDVKSATIEPLPYVVARLWHAMFDKDEENAKLAKQLWEHTGFQLIESQALWAAFYSVLSSPVEQIRVQAGRAISAALAELPSAAVRVLRDLFALYTRNVPPPVKEASRVHQAVLHGKALAHISPEEEEGAALETEPQSDLLTLGSKPPKGEIIHKLEIRSGVALTLGECATVLGAEHLPLVLDFFIKHALTDLDKTVIDHATKAGMEIIAKQGQTHMGTMLPIIENYLDRPAPSQLPAHISDQVREAVVIFLGTLARHLAADDPKVRTVIDRLLEVLKTPAESVQKAVGQCLGSLLKNITEETQKEKYVSLLLERLLKGSSYGDRRGAAYGLAGLVKGIGIPILKQYGIMDKLQAAVENKKSINTRQGSLFAFECLSTMLKLSFEPYVIQILPKLLLSFSDQSEQVREATADAARAIMGNLSGHGVKLVLPALLKALEDRSKNWRTKQAAVELLGTMAFCNPRQLSTCLPTIVPRLGVVLTDTHQKIVEAARIALENIGAVIRNPEIQAHVPVLIQAIYDPDKNTIAALDALLNTSFVHVIDVPSLALIMPILSRALKDRKTEVKKKSAQIVGNMCSLADHKDLIPYLEILIPELQNILTDPIPDVRTVSAKALGTLVQGIGEQNFSTLIPWLLETMHSDAGSVERTGAAQGLSEVIAGLGVGKFEELLPQIMDGTEDPKWHIREGYIGLFVYLPSALKEKFPPYMGTLLPAILKGLADETESVREISLRAGQAFVTQYAETSIDVMLPTLLEGLFDDNWRIRQSSTMLVGDLLFHFLDKDQKKENQQRLISGSLDADVQADILSRLYMLRSDPNAVVRQQALMVWKSVVEHTPATLKRVLPKMMHTIIQCLGSSVLDKREVGGKTLGDLVNKLGDRILPDIIPILEEGLRSPLSDTRQGVCLGLTEVIASAQKHQIAEYLHIIMPAVSRALYDPLDEVREAAALAFDRLYKSVTSKAIDDIVPDLLEQLENPEVADYALDGLRQIITLRAAAILPYLIPKLTKPPINAFSAKALSSVAEVAGPSLYPHLGILIPCLIEAMQPQPDVAPEELESAKSYGQKMVLCVREDGMHILFAELLRAADNSSSASFRTSAVTLLGTYCAESKVDFRPHVPMTLKKLIELLNDSAVEVQKAAWSALDSLMKAIEKNEQPGFVADVRLYLSYVRDDLRKQGKTALPGLCLPKGLDAILPLFLQGLMFGSPEQREASALGMGDLIEMTTPQALGPFVIKITGPLIRIIGDRFPPRVKLAILRTLSMLLDRGGPMLKPFLPQLQTTFVKALSDATFEVRDQAAIALGKLMGMHTRVDPLVTELMSGINEATGGIQEAMLGALQRVLISAGDKVKPEILSKIAPTLFELLQSDEENTRLIVSRCLAAYSKFCSPDEFERIIKTELSVEAGDVKAQWKLRHAYTLTLEYILRYAFERVSSNEDLLRVASNHVVAMLKDDKPPVKKAAISCAESYLVLLGEQHPAFGAAVQSLLPLLAKATADQQADIRQAAVKSIKQFAKKCPDTSSNNLELLVPALFNRVKDRASMPVKLAAERALLHVLRIHADPELLMAYAGKPTAMGGNKAEAKALVDYCKRILAKLAPESEDEREI